MTRDDYRLLNREIRKFSKQMEKLEEEDDVEYVVSLREDTSVRFERRSPRRRWPRWQHRDLRYFVNWSSLIFGMMIAPVVAAILVIPMWIVHIRQQWDDLSIRDLLREGNRYWWRDE